MKLFILFLLLAFHANAVVTIAPVDIGKQSGVSGGVKGSFVTKRGNINSDKYSASLRVVYDNNNSYVAWSDFSFSYAKASGELYTKKTYVHLRYIHTLYKKQIDWEAFVQSQTDEFTKVNTRLLTGIGLRYHKTIRDYGDIYLGLGSFTEYIDYTTNRDSNENNIRLNIYIAYKNSFTKNVMFSYIGYYQPRVDSFSDLILSNLAQLKVKIYKKFSINFELIYNQDEKPAIGVQKYDFTQKTSFVYDF